MNNLARFESDPLGLSILQIVSGGQTGADRAGLDFAIASGITHGVWCREWSDGVQAITFYPVEQRSRVQDRLRGREIGSIIHGPDLNPRQNYGPGHAIFLRHVDGAGT